MGRLKRISGWECLAVPLVKAAPEFAIDRAAGDISRSFGRVVRAWREDGGHVAEPRHKLEQTPDGYRLVDAQDDAIVDSEDRTGFTTFPAIHLPEGVMIPSNQLVFFLNLNVEVDRLLELPIELAVKRTQWKAYAKAHSSMAAGLGIEITPPVPLDEEEQLEAKYKTTVDWVSRLATRRESDE